MGVKRVTVEKKIKEFRENYQRIEIDRERGALNRRDKIFFFFFQPQNDVIWE